MAVMDLIRTTRLIGAEEGCRLRAYKDSLGYWTIGYGHMLGKEDKWADLEWTQADADAQLRRDVQTAIKGLPLWALSLDDVRQAVLTSMTLQLGAAGVAKFKRTLAAIKACEYDKAGQYMAESLWAKQTPARASRAIRMMVCGCWPAKVNGVQIA